MDIQAGAAPGGHLASAGSGGFGLSGGSAGRHYWIGLITVVAVAAALIDARLWRPGHRIGFRENVQVGEAQAWWSGRLDLPERLWDTALKDGQAFSHFPPAFSLVSATIAPLGGGVPHWFLVCAVLLPIPMLSYRLFYGLTKSAGWAALLALALVCGTSAWPVLRLALRDPSPYYVNQALALCGTLLFLGEYFAPRRIWLAGAGVVLAGLSRQLTAAYLVPLAWLALAGANGGLPRTRRLALVLACVVTVFGLQSTLNALKFGHPFESGYALLYEGRPDDQFSRDARQFGIFHPHYVPRNMYYANLGAPELHKVVIERKPEWHVTPNDYGVGIWWTSPILVWAIIDMRRIWAAPQTRALLIAAGIIAAALLFYHSTGFAQRGFNRYSLDYIPALLAIIAPVCVAAGRRWITAAMTSWSFLYFVVLLPRPHVRIW